MSYCRWSTDDFQCDLYIYEDVSGGWTTHVAGGRVVWHEGALPEPIDYATDPVGHFDRMIAVSRLMPVDELEGNENFHREGIDLPLAGETFNDSTPGACAARVEHLIDLGYRCPSEVVTELRIEQANLDRESRRSSVFDRPPGNVYDVPEGVIPEAMMEKFDD